MRRAHLIEHMRPVLRKRRAELRRLLDEDLQTIVGEYEENLGDTADLAIESGSREVNARLVDAESRELEHIEEALERLRDGSYGTCTECGKSIPMSRLQALPFATTCIHCQRRLDSSLFPSSTPYANGLSGAATSDSWSMPITPTAFN